MLRKGLSYGLAVFLWIACAFELAMLVVRTAQDTLGDALFVGRLLTQPDAADRIAPLSVLAIFSWVMVQVMAQAVRVFREQAAVEALKGSADPTTIKIPERLRAGHRAGLIQQHLSSPAPLTEALPAAAALDALALENSYGLLKAYVWTLPVLGFIGTAWGMAHAIGGFSEALRVVSGNQDQIKVLTDRLGQLVIPGLAGAFSVTMLALGASVLAHFWVTALQLWDREVLHQLDRISVEKLAQIAAEEDLRDLQKPLAGKIAVLTEQLNTLITKLDLGDTAERLNQAAVAHYSAAQEVRTAALQLQAFASAPYHITITREQVQ